MFIDTHRHTHTYINILLYTYTLIAHIQFEVFMLNFLSKMDFLFFPWKKNKKRNWLDTGIRYSENGETKYIVHSEANNS